MQVIPSPCQDRRKAGVFLLQQALQLLWTESQRYREVLEIAQAGIEHDRDASGDGCRDRLIIERHLGNPVTQIEIEQWLESGQATIGRSIEIFMREYELVVRSFELDRAVEKCFMRLRVTRTGMAEPDEMGFSSVASITVLAIR